MEGKAYPVIQMGFYNIKRKWTVVNKGGKK